MTSTSAAKRPEELRIFGRTYSITYVPQEALAGLSGLCDNGLQLIHIAEGQGSEEQKDSVLHEGLHAVIYVIKLVLSQALEERVVTALAAALVGLMQDNPEFAKWLCQKEA